MDDIEALLKLGVDVNEQDHLGNTALHYAAAAGHAQAVARLLANDKVKVNVANNMGDTPLHKATWRGALEVVKQLLARGADVNAKNRTGERPVQFAKDPAIGALVEPTPEGDVFLEDSDDDGAASDSD